MSRSAAATLLIAGCSIVGVALGRWPCLRANRSTITLLGVALLLAIGALTLPQAYAALDLNTLLLLFSMMVLNGHLFLAGFFGVVTQGIVRKAHRPHALLALVIDVPTPAVLGCGILSREAKYRSER